MGEVVRKGKLLDAIKRGDEEFEGVILEEIVAAKSKLFN